MSDDVEMSLNDTRNEMAEMATAYINDVNDNSEDSNHVSSYKLLKELLSNAFIENERRTRTLMNIEISDDVIFIITLVLQLSVFIIVTMNQLVNYDINEQLNFDNSLLQLTVESTTFKMLSTSVLAIASTVLISSILEFIGSRKTMQSIYHIIYKFLLYLTIISPFWGTYTVVFLGIKSYLRSIEAFYYIYFFNAQQNILATFLACELGLAYNNKLINYYSLSLLLLMFHIGTGLVLAYTRNDYTDDSQISNLINLSYAFSYTPIIAYFLIFVVHCIYYKIQGLLEFNKSFCLSVVAIAYEIGLSIIIENIGVNPVDQTGHHILGFTSMVFCVLFIGVFVPQHLSRIQVNQYLSALDAAVLEKQQYEREKDIYSELLSKILPEKIVEDLRNNRPLLPDFFKEATIFFSDIEGFTKICAAVNPIEVVNMLNKLYSAMDLVASKFPTYKIETIGDAFVIASGLPEKNASHAINIANFALVCKDVVSLVSSPLSTPIRIRIGIHSGPVVGAVVGTKMPRYCIFGDTVNTTARMESTGIVDKIQISEDTYKILSVTNEFIMEERGIIEVKGKGQMKTYFLVNYSQNNKTLSPEVVNKIKSEVQCIINSTSDYSFSFNVALNKQSLHRTLSMQSLHRSQSNQVLNIYPSLQGSKLRNRSSSIQSGVSSIQSGVSSKHTVEPLFYTDLEQESEVDVVMPYGKEEFERA